METTKWNNRVNNEEVLIKIQSERGRKLDGMYVSHNIMRGKLILITVLEDQLKGERKDKGSWLTLREGIKKQGNWQAARIDGDLAFGTCQSSENHGMITTK